ncbi:hypothetical protein [Massilia soli]|nr:hypothetical protein [Massilia soli]
MQKLIKMLIVGSAAALAGCVGMTRTAPVPGDTVADTQAKFGAPTAVYAAPSGQVMEYATGPMGQYTWMAKVGPDGRLVSFEQVLTGEKFATLKIGKARKEDVLRTIGRPAETSFLSLPQLEVWSYRYKEAGVWNSMMHVHFDRSGVLSMMQNGPDPMYEERRFFLD